MRDSHVRLAALVCLALAVGLPAGLRADESFESRIEGTWEASVSESKARENIDREIEDLLDQMIFFKRPFARGELREATDPCSTLRIGLGDEKLTMRCDDLKPTTSRKDGTSTEWTSYDGESYTLSQTVESDRIVQTFDSDRGLRTNIYSLKDDDTLLLEVELDSGQIPEPLTYERTFERAE